jgi:ABC-2 type transport system permease protein
MGKYAIIISAFWQRALTYRFTVVAYRIGDVLNMLFLIILWQAIFAGQDLVRGYSLQEMITYVIMGNFLVLFSRTYQVDYLANNIKDGRLTMFLVKPMHFLHFLAVSTFGRIAMLIIFSVLVQLPLMLFFRESIIWNTSLATWIVIVPMLTLAFLTELMISYLIASIAFWTDEVAGVYDAIGKLRRIFAGDLFPLSFLPALMVQVSFMLPFAYAFFVPTQLYLNKISIETGLKGLAIQVIWVVVLFFVLRFTWNKGLKRYEGVGI